MKNTKQMEKKLEERIRSLMESLNGLEKEMDEEMSREEFIIFLEEMIDTFSDAIEVADVVRIMCLKENDPSDKPTSDTAKEMDLKEKVVKLFSGELAGFFELLIGPKAAPVKESGCPCCPVMDEDPEVNEMPDPTGQEPDPSAVLSFGSDDLRVLPFPHIHRICPWLDDRSVMRSVPGAKDVYYLFEEGSQVRIGRDLFLVGPVVMIKLNDDHFLESPNALDLHRVRKFLKDNTRSVVFEEGAAYPALHFV